MLPDFLLPQTVVEANGTGPALPLRNGHGALLLTLGIEEAAEQASLLVSVVGSPDGVEWVEPPLLEWPQKFYPGTSALYLPESHLVNRPMQFLRAQWKTNRWGRGSKVATFHFYVFIEEISA